MAKKRTKQPRVPASEVVRRLVIENPAASDAEIAEMAKAAGHKIPLPTLRGETRTTRGTLRALEALGYAIVRKEGK